MKHLLFFIACLLFSSQFSSAQNVFKLGNAHDFYDLNRNYLENRKHILTESDIVGSPYLNDEFIIGMVFTTSNIEYQNIPLRYNIYNDEIEFKTPDNQIMAIATPELIEKIEFGDFRMKYIPYSISKEIIRGFLKELVNDKVSLYSKPEIFYSAAQDAVAYKDAQPAKFVKKPDTYYLRIGKEEAKKIDNKNEFIQCFPKHQKEVATYIKKNKIKINKEDKLIEVVKYYNSL